jgi:MoxR-like ATPase
LLRYAATLVGATHPESELAPDLVRRYVRNGASPRGAQALVLGGKALALSAGRTNLATEDMWKVAPMSLRHRLVLGYEAMADGIRPDQIVDEVLEAYPTPEAVE